MAGLTREGFTPLTNAELVTRISSRLKAFSPGIDLSSESPDGQLVEIFSFELSQVWSELNLVYQSNNPLLAVGDGLRNIGMITGLVYGAATRSQANVDLAGVTGTIVPVNSVVSDDAGNEFITSFEAVIPASVQVVARLAGTTPVDAGTITTILSPITGWASVVNPTSGIVGSPPQTEVEFRNLRNRTVLRNFVSVEDIIRARLLENLRIEQVVVLNNDSPSVTLPDGTPPNTIHVTVGEVGPTVTDEEIALVILYTKGLACPTFGTTTITVADTQGNPHAISFSKATPKNVFLNIEVLFLEAEYAGAEEAIRADLVTHINSLDTDEDVVWSRLFGIITPHAKAQVNVLETSTDGLTYSPANISVNANEFAATLLGNINIVVAN